MARYTHSGKRDTHKRGLEHPIVRNDLLVRAVGRTIRRHRLLRDRDSVLVAVSGGADSVALLAALVEIGGAGWRVGVGHVNHRLRGAASDRDQRFVERLAARLGCEAYVAEAAIAGG